MYANATGWIRIRDLGNGESGKSALTFHLTELVPLAFKCRQFCPKIEILPQGIYLWPVVVQRAASRIGMPDEFEAEQVLNFAFLPIDGMDGIGE